MNIKNLFGFLFLFLLITSCNKIEEVEEEIPVESVVLYKGSFISGEHTTSGEVEVIKVGTATKLSFKNLKSDAGPDLRIYLAQDLKAKAFTEVTNQVNNGTYTIDIPENVDIKSNKYVLIWCKKFSVLFGSAELK